MENEGAAKAPSFAALFRCFGDLPHHIIDEDPVPRCGVVDENVGDGAHQLAVLDNGAAAHG